MLLLKGVYYKQNKEECFSRVPRLSDTRYSAKETKPATYPRSQYMVIWAADRFKRYGRYSGRGKLLFRY